MKNLILFLLIILSSLVSCKKDNAVVNNGLIGKWELTEYFISPGDAGAWHQADNATRHTVEFKADGSFICSNNSYNGATMYQQTDSIRIKFLQPQTGAETECYFTIEDNNRTLILSPSGCIEGCSNKYKAIDNGSVGK